MASGFFAVFDDIAILMDDMATMSQVATKKTAGILGDDLAVAAEQASGFLASRELPVIWAIFKGSALNKLIILPLAFLLSAFAPFLIAPILIMGGIYLAYEGMEKIYEYLFHKNTEQKANHLVSKTKEELLAYEKVKVESAIRTDFILSIEIIIIALSAVSQEELMVQIGVVIFIAFLATVAVYGLVALLVRMDDFGYKLVSMSNDTNTFMHKFGQLLIASLPKVIRTLTVIGTIAMLLVAGGIFVHNIHAIHDALTGIPAILGELLIGAIVGTLALIPMELYHQKQKV